MTREEMLVRNRTNGLCPLNGPCDACDPQHRHERDDAEQVLMDVWPEVERLRSWAGLMETLDAHYPADVFTGTSGDKGPRIIALTREVDRLLKRQLAVADLIARYDDAPGDAYIPIGALRDAVSGGER